MRYRALGNSGLVVSVVGLGCNNFGGRLDKAGTQAVVDAAIDAGITLFDTAEGYGGGTGGASEELLGEALAGRRDQVVLDMVLAQHDSDEANGAAVQAGDGRTSGGRSSARSAGCGPTTSTCTRSTPLTRTPPSRRPWARCTSW
jgi:hypothetical protein